MGLFERYLSLWVTLGIAVGILLGRFFRESIAVLNELSIASVNIPIAILVWLMIFPMMVQIDFSAIKDVRKSPLGLTLTLIINWLVKPFTMAFFAWLFFDIIYDSILDENLAKEYIAGAIILGAAPCTAMVFVWSYLTKGDPEYTLVQVAVNDLILLFAFIPIVNFFLGITQVSIPFDTLTSSVVIFVLIPLVAGVLANRFLTRSRGEEWLKEVFMPRLKPFSMVALLTTLILLFALQGDKILTNPFHILLISVPLTIQTYFIFFTSWAI
ncbi:MAG: arsenical-resistance protein, partial [Bdellovibrionaceae bacterium]|nr:arsenical-resistance protein [Pseudobdellovibrionaceae bacterium]